MTQWQNDDYYFHAMRIQYPGTDIFQVRLYDRKNQKLIFENTKDGSNLDKTDNIKKEETLF